MSFKSLNSGEQYVLQFYVSPIVQIRWLKDKDLSTVTSRGISPMAIIL